MWVYFSIFCRVTFIVLFAWSTWSKVRNFAAFKEAIMRFAILPQRLVLPASCLALVSELSVVTLLIAGHVWAQAGFVLATALLLVFSVAMISVLRRGINTSCNCFGHSDRNLSSVEVWRNLGLLCLALTCVVGNFEMSHDLPSRVMHADAAFSVLMSAVAVACTLVVLNLSDLVELVRAVDHGSWKEE